MSIEECKLINPDEHRWLAEHVAGSSYRTIGQRHSISHESARRAVLEDAARFIGDVELSLYVAAKLEQLGRGDEAVWPAFLIPELVEEDWRLALSLFAYVVDQLRERDLNIEITHRATPAGCAFMITLGEFGMEPFAPERLGRRKSEEES
jgi:hypothetical protein